MSLSKIIKKRKYKAFLEFIKAHRRLGGGEFTILTTGSEIIIYPSDNRFKNSKGESPQIRIKEMLPSADSKCRDNFYKNEHVNDNHMCIGCGEHEVLGEMGLCDKCIEKL